jgi:hypothetical protein
MRATLLAVFLTFILPTLAAADDGKQAALAALLESDAPAPDGFVRQKLDVTDGLIFRPKDWFFASAGTSTGWIWTLSQEDSSKGPYLTGMGIQLIPAVSRQLHLTPGALAQEALKQKREAAVSVVSECAVTMLGTFQRQCLETIEDSPTTPGLKFHVQYSVFWGGDMVVLATFGAPVDKWDAMKPIGETMMAFRLIGPNFGKN